MKVKSLVWILACAPSCLFATWHCLYSGQDQENGAFKTWSGLDPSRERAEHIAEMFCKREAYSETCQFMACRYIHFVDQSSPAVEEVPLPFK